MTISIEQKLWRLRQALGKTEQFPWNNFVGQNFVTLLHYKTVKTNSLCFTFTFCIKKSPYLGATRSHDNQYTFCRIPHSVLGRCLMMKSFTIHLTSSNFFLCYPNYDNSTIRNYSAWVLHLAHAQTFPRYFVPPIFQHRFVKYFTKQFLDCFRLLEFFMWYPKENYFLTSRNNLTCKVLSLSYIFRFRHS